MRLPISRHYYHPAELRNCFPNIELMYSHDIAQVFSPYVELENCWFVEDLILQLERSQVQVKHSLIAAVGVDKW